MEIDEDFIEKSRIGKIRKSSKRTEHASVYNFVRMRLYTAGIFGATIRRATTVCFDRPCATIAVLITHVCIPAALAQIFERALDASAKPASGAEHTGHNYVLILCIPQAYRNKSTEIRQLTNSSIW